MRQRLPRPVLAALGAVSQVRRVPGALVQAPILAMVTFDRVRRTYDELALRGQQVVAGTLGAADEPAPPPVAAPVPDPVTEAVAHVVDPMEAPHATYPRGPEPLPGYDAMTLGALRGHLRTLTVTDLERVLSYERGHLARPPMLTLVEHRLAKLDAG